MVACSSFSKGSREISTWDHSVLKLPWAHGPDKSTSCIYIYIYIYILILIPNPDQNLRRHCLHQKIARSERPSNLKHSFGLSVLLQCCLGFAQSKQLFLKVFCLHQCAKFNWEVDRPKTTPTQTDTLRTPLMLKYLWVRSLDRYNSTDWQVFKEISTTLTSPIPNPSLCRCFKQVSLGLRLFYTQIHQALLLEGELGWEGLSLMFHDCIHRAFVAMATWASFLNCSKSVTLGKNMNQRIPSSQYVPNISFAEAIRNLDPTLHPKVLSPFLHFSNVDRASVS